MYMLEVYILSTQCRSMCNPKTIRTLKVNKNLAIANRSRVSCAHNTSRSSIGLITHDREIYVNGRSRSLKMVPFES